MCDGALWTLCEAVGKVSFGLIPGVFANCPKILSLFFEAERIGVEGPRSEVELA